MVLTLHAFKCLRTKRYNSQTRKNSGTLVCQPHRDELLPRLGVLQQDGHAEGTLYDF